MDNHMFVAVPADRPRTTLRNYVPDNSPWNPNKTEQTLSDDQKAKILDDANKVIYSVEYMYEDCMPDETKLLADKNCSNTELIVKAMELRNRQLSAVLSEIIFTPVYQKIEGFPKIYSAQHDIVRVLENFNQNKDDRILGDWLYAQ